MFVEFPENGSPPGHGYVIVGAGVAGLLLAERLSADGRVLVIEAGNEKVPRAAGYGYYEIDATGKPGIRTVNSRLSALGGTSNHWAGLAVPMSPVVFENRERFPGWPIRFEEYARYLPEAEKFLNLAPQAFDDPEPYLVDPLLADHRHLRILHARHSHPIRRLGDAASIARFAAHPAIDVLLDTRVVDIHLDAAGGRAASIDLLHRPSRRAQTLSVRTLILCGGGIENPRLMLWAGRKYPAGNPLGGGPNALTGKWFVEHPNVRPLDMFVDERVDLTRLAPPFGDERVDRLYFSFTDEFIDRQGLPRFSALMPGAVRWADDGQAAEGDRWLALKSGGYWHAQPRFTFEQTPTAASRIELSSRLDIDGFPLARAHWHVEAEDYVRMRRTVVLFASLISQRGVARCRLKPEARGEDWSGVPTTTTEHHMGATRMAGNRGAGVVDADARVFGLDNLYVAGASVFPSCDWVNPTLNLAALAARLADHLIRARRRPVISFGFRAEGGRAAVLRGGWSKLEPEGVWSNAEKAGMLVPVGEATEIRFYGKPYAEARVELRINGRKAFEGPAGGIFAKSFGLGADGLAKVEFRFDNLSSPKSLGESLDGRTLGIFLEEVQLR